MRGCLEVVSRFERGQRRTMIAVVHNRLSFRGRLPRSPLARPVYVRWFAVVTLICPEGLRRLMQLLRFRSSYMLNELYWTI